MGVGILPPVLVPDKRDDVLDHLSQALAQVWCWLNRPSHASRHQMRQVEADQQRRDEALARIRRDLRLFARSHRR